VDTAGAVGANGLRESRDTPLDAMVNLQLGEVHYFSGIADASDDIWRPGSLPDYLAAEVVERREDKPKRLSKRGGRVIESRVGLIPHVHVGAARRGARRNPRRRTHAIALSAMRSAATTVIEMAVASVPDAVSPVDSTSGPRAVTMALASGPWSTATVGASSKRIA